MDYRKPWRSAGALAVLAVLFTACSGGGSSPSATEAAPTEGGGAASSEPSAEASASSGETAALPEPELTEIKIGLNGTEASQITLAAASELGTFEKYGITSSEYTAFEGDGQAAAAIQAGELDVVSVSAAVVLSSELTDQPLVSLAVPAKILTDDIICTEDVKTVEDAIGKRIAISTFGGTSNGAALLGIKAMGLEPDQMTITQVGGQSERIAALEGGSIECAVVDSNLEQDMLDQGFNVLAQLKSAGIEWARSTIATTKEWLEENPNTALVVVAAALEAQDKYWTDPDAMVEVFSKINQISAEDAEVQVRDFQDVGNQSFMWADDAFQNPKEVTATVNAGVADVALEDTFDRSILEQLVEMGFYEEHNIPTE